jgi:hypothetical protein
MRQVQAANIGHILTGEFGMIGVHEDYVDREVGDSVQDDVHIYATGMHAELRAPAERAHQQLALHLVGVGDQDADGARSGNSYRSHKFTSAL